MGEWDIYRKLEKIRKESRANFGLQKEGGPVVYYQKNGQKVELLRGNGLDYHHISQFLEGVEKAVEKAKTLGRRKMELYMSCAAEYAKMEHDGDPLGDLALNLKGFYLGLQAMKYERENSG